MRIYRIIILAVLIMHGKTLAGQVFISPDSISRVRIFSMNPRVYQSHDTTWIFSGICKTLKTTMLTGEQRKSFIKEPASKKNPFFTVNGNIQYDYLYRSFADTPFYQKDFRQHTLRFTLAVYAGEKYPFRVNFLIRKSNSPYFRNFFDGGFHFDKYTYLHNIKQELLRRINKNIPELSYLDAAKKLLEEQIQQYVTLKNKLGANGLAQELIEERERAYFKQLNKPDVTLPGAKVVDSLKGELEGLVNEKKKQLDSLQNNIEKLRTKVDSIQHNISGVMAKATMAINKIKSPGELVRASVAYGLEDKKAKWERFVTNIRSVGIGRSVLNYSELTARNVSLTGLNLEYNPKMYFAVAAGKIDYGFRDFFGKNSRSVNQHLLMGRIGFGDIEKKAVIFSFFTGRKANYGSVISDTVSGSVLVTGYAVEAIIRKDEKTSFSVEFAKSTKPVTGNYADNKELGSLLRFSDQSNFGISAAGQTEIESTKTKLSGIFRKTGENFQSFSLFTYNTDQTAWMVKAEQPLFKDRVNIEGAIRRNDFVNPFTEKTFKTSTVFGSARLSVRIPKWPALSLGYHPGSQLYIIDRNRIRENVYYILNGSIIHQYSIADLRMASSVIYNNYTTKGTDSGFVNYSGKNYMLSQSLYFRKLQLQGNLMYTDQQELLFYTLEANADYTLKSFLRLGAGVKYNKIITGNSYWGGTGQVMLNIKGMGSLQLQYDKSFLPTIQQTLFPVEIGRLTWFKNF